MKPSVGDLVKVTWVDIQSDSSWTDNETLEPAVCTSYGIFNGYKKGNLYLYASFNDTDIGDRSVIPESLIKDIVTIKKNARREHRNSERF